MRLKQAILNVMDADTLRQVVEEYELEVADRRKIDHLSDAISRAKRTRPNELLEYLSEQEVKRVCELMEIDLTGRRRTLIERLLSDVEQPEKSKPFLLVSPGQKSQVKPVVKRESVEVTPPLPIPIQKYVATPEGSFEFEPIKGYPMLHWRGKRPFTSTQYYPAQLKEVYGEEVNGWRNKIYWGDNLQVMSHLLKEFRGEVDLIYIDPPFDSKADYKKTISVKGSEINSDLTPFEEKQYTDLWTNDEYLQFIYERLVLAKELLSDTGSIYLHCDWHKSHHIRCLLDEVFGADSFVNEIIWMAEGGGTSGLRYSRKHQTIFFYSKGKDDSQRIFNADAVRIPYKTENIRPQTYHFENNAKKRPGFKDGYTWVPNENGKIPTDVWIDCNLAESDGIPLDVWHDIKGLYGPSGEITGYPTQKPLSLLERIIKASSSPGDLVFDFFMGAGTSMLASMKLGRRFIGADINLAAIQISSKRLYGLSNSLKSGLPAEENLKYFGFDVYTVNQYDVFRNPAEAKDLLIEAFEIQKLERNSVFDGEKDGRMVKILPVNRIATRADLNDLISGLDYKACEERQALHPHQPVEKILLVCMGHEPDLKAHLQKEVPYKLDVEIVDILRDKANLEFKRESVAKVSVKGGELTIERFYPMNLLQKLSLQKEAVTEWRELVESVMIDWNYDGAVLQPTEVDIPGKNALVAGRYKIPDDAGNIRVKITDLLSESLEVVVAHG